MEYEDLDPDRKVITVPPGAAGRERFFACTVVLVCTDDNFSQLLSFSLNNLRISGRAFHETLTFQEVWRRFLARPQNALKNRRRP
jgi:hypothetical protein